MNDTIKIAIAGDCSDWNLHNLSKKDIPAKILNKISESDMFIFNLEGPIANGDEEWELIGNKIIKGLLKSFGKLQPKVTSSENVLDALNLAEINVACLANNHIRDAGKEGVKNTIRCLKKKKFLYLGAGENIKSASKPFTIKIKNKKVCIVNYNFVGWNKFGQFYNIFGATKRREGANYMSRNKVVDNLRKLKNENDILIAIIHIGRELKDKLSTSDESFLNKLPADLVVFHHAHILQKITTEKNVVSCGDFIFNRPGYLYDRNANIFFYNYGSEIIALKIKVKRGIPCLEN